MEQNPRADTTMGTCTRRDFPGGTVVKNPPANTEDTGSSPDPGRFHMPRSNKTHAPQLLSLRSGVCKPQLLSPCATTNEARFRASLVAQWLRICLPTQGTRVRALAREDPTCRGATKPVHHND
ncbi:hypothetical protein J1605_011346 [Eschrichtius robustus]|uniref:Uncharacterized protein n=1 Tax=Eschrichtius robustus TaxID=9764 RepID=A0AB34GQA5_ESCRO|nr:hypothetical protein J1605_011346 [Eschrichtius robustus]